MLDPEWRLQHKATLTYEGFLDALQRTNPDTSPGADAWRVSELKKAGEVAIRVWVQIWNHCTSGDQAWPEAFTYTKIVLPARKHCNPAKISDARPINVMALLYRISCKAITREVLMQLSHRLPASISGGLPGRSSADLWYHTQYIIEQSLEQGTELYGAVTDLQKFFNSIPRIHLHRLLISFGIDRTWATQWINLLDSMKKTVVVAQDFSLPRTSICGIPEGCPFSVAAAVMIGAHLTAWITTRTEATALIYIDNIEILSKDSHEIHQATSLALRFFDAWAFRIDRDKSWSWTTSDPQQHKDAASFEIVAARLNLGSFQRYRKSTKHGHLAVRLQEGISRAKCIAALPLDVKARLQAINAGPMQVALYGSEISYVGDQAIQGMRTAISRVLACPNRGTNHKVVMITQDSGIHDPKVHIILRAIRTARRAFWKFPNQYEDFALHMFANGGDCRKAWGPASTLAAYFTSISIAYDQQGYITLADHGNRVHLFYSGFSDIESIVLQAWYNKTFPELTKRQQLHDLQDLDLALTSRILDKMPPKDARVARTFLSGGFPTAIQAKHWTDTTDSCRLCGRDDTLAHRVLVCESTSRPRALHPVLATGRLRAEAPWARSIQAHNSLRDLWDGIAMPELSNTVCDGEDGLTLYTDGTCDRPADLQIAQAAWAVVLDPLPGIAARTANHSRIEQHIAEMHVQECGRCPGRQSIGRAELLALAVAIARVKHLRVVSDCKGAIDIANSLLGGQGLERYANHQNFDVISYLHRAIHKWPPGLRRIVISKIKSHQQPPFALTCVRDVAGNEAADTAAKRTLAHSLPELQRILRDARDHKGRETRDLPLILSGVVDTTRTFIQAIKSTRASPDAPHENPPPRGDFGGIVFDSHNRFFQYLHSLHCNGSNFCDGLHRARTSDMLLGLKCWFLSRNILDLPFQLRIPWLTMYTAHQECIVFCSMRKGVLELNLLPSRNYSIRSDPSSNRILCHGTFQSPGPLHPHRSVLPYAPGALIRGHSCHTISGFARS